MICRTIVEGTTKVSVPVPPPDANFPPSAAPVFYNPEMELNRDINVAATAAFVERLLSKKRYRERRSVTWMLFQHQGSVGSGSRGK